MEASPWMLGGILSLSSSQVNEIFSHCLDDVKSTHAFLKLSFENIMF